ncbi:molybdopterin molybdotransferase [Bacillus pakistanensis]|uniref:Molybdopterin molybdenumtransferase n=1 Tax=Rossellomorea pakistanensis TaxID=992288 RepID=A0ABS2N8C7_9BACI|nr:gephyrin-like molybdotransferase Glp [Bacillus pakistanensis]MBM7584106.1 molybdopterin molybdotransferase [Bacillus pakistanensis]
MSEKRNPITVHQAVKTVMKWKKRGNKNVVNFSECDDGYLFDPICADHPVPPFNRSPYDGYAIRSQDTELLSSNNSIDFEVIDEIPAGHTIEKIVGKNQTVKIMTGGAIPPGADAVIMKELVSKKEGGKYITIKRKLKPGENISFKGEDVEAGTEIISKGTYINPGVKALLATFGYSKVPLVKKPIIGLIATGSELLHVHEPLAPGKIRNSNSHMVSSQIKRAGGNVNYYGQIGDDLEDLVELTQKALLECDFIITTGGVSVGDYDHLPEVYRSINAQELFNKVAMRPGSVTTVAEKEGKLLFGLSGNPSACYVGFELFVRPIIRYWNYSDSPYVRPVKAYLNKDFPKANPFTRFVRGELQYSSGDILFKPVGLDKSNAVSSLAKSDALMILPGGTRGYKKGNLVDVLLLEDQKGSEEMWDMRK